jgi:hypothetical protein
MWRDEKDPLKQRAAREGLPAPLRPKGAGGSSALRLLPFGSQIARWHVSRC